MRFMKDWLMSTTSLISELMDYQLQFSTLLALTVVIQFSLTFQSLKVPLRKATIKLINSATLLDGSMLISALELAFMQLKLI